MNKIVILINLCILVLSIGFTVLTTEKINYAGEEVTFCRPIEFWCYQTQYATYAVLPDGETEVQFWHYNNGYGDITVKDGEFLPVWGEDDSDIVLTDVDDGEYNNLGGIMDDDGFLHTKEVGYKIIGTIDW